MSSDTMQATHRSHPCFSASGTAQKVLPFRCALPVAVCEPGDSGYSSRFRETGLNVNVCVGIEEILQKSTGLEGAVLSMKFISSELR